MVELGDLNKVLTNHQIGSCRPVDGKVYFFSTNNNGTSYERAIVFHCKDVKSIINEIRNMTMTSEDLNKFM